MGEKSVILLNIRGFTKIFLRFKIRKKIKIQKKSIFNIFCRFKNFYDQNYFDQLFFLNKILSHTFIKKIFDQKCY